MKTMRIIVAGGREFNNYSLLCKKLDYFFQNITAEIVCGEARGADSLGKKYAVEHGLKVHSYPAEWDKYGKSAGYKRNDKMSIEADAAVCFWDGKSKGTKHMIDTMKKLNKPIRVVKY